MSIPVIEETRYDGATLSWNLFPGATGYRSKVYEKATGRLTDVVDVPADASSMPLDGLDPETEYGIVFTPLRMVGNIETSMGTYDLALKTAAVPTANGEIPMAKAATVWGKDGRLSVHLASPRKSISALLTAGCYRRSRFRRRYELGFIRRTLYHPRGK